MRELTKGTRLPPLVKPPITKEQLENYAQASLDNNPIHLSDAAAVKAGLPGVIAHGMLTMGFMGEFLVLALAKTGFQRISDMSCRFKAMTFPGDTITIDGTIRDVKEGKMELELIARNQRGGVTCTGHATLER